MGKNRDTYRANPDVIKRKGNTFNEAKNEYVSDCYKVWKSSYLNTNKSNVVTALNNKVSSYMENILNSYKNLVAFFEDYYNEIVDLEKALSEGSLSASKVLDVKIAISQLKAMAEGYDPDDIVINPKTGEFNEGRTKQAVAQSISALGVKDDFKVYVDASGKYREAGNMTSSEYTQYNNAVRTFGARPDKINNFLGHETAVKLGGLNAASISKSPAAYAVMDASPFMLKSAGSTAFGGIYSDAEIATIEKAKASGAYQYTYMGVQTAIFFALGGTGAAEAAGSTVLKSVGRMGSKKVFSDVVGDTIINAPLNVSDSLKQSQDVRGRINSDSFKVNLLSTIGGDVGLGGGMELGGKILKTLPLSSAISSPKSASGSTSGTVSINKPGTAGTNIPDINKPNDNPGVQTTPETKKPTSSNPAPKTKGTKPAETKTTPKTNDSKPAETKTTPKTNDSKPAETKTTPKTNGSKPAETKVEKQSENYSTITNQTNTTRTAPETSEPKIQTTTEKKTSTNDKEISKNEDLNKSKDKPETTSSKPTSESKIPSKNTDRMKDDSKNTNAGIGSKEVGKETMKRRVITRIVKNKDEVVLKATGTDGKPVAMKNGNPQNRTIDYEMVNENIDDSSNIISLRDMSSTGSSGNGNVTPISSVNSKSVNENLNSQQQNLEMSGAYIYDQYRNANDSSVVREKGNPKSQKLEEVTPTTPSKGKKELDEAIHEKQKEYLDKQIKDEPKSETKPSSDKSVTPEEKSVETKETSKKTEPETKDTSSAKSNSDESHLAEKQQKFKESKEELKNKYNDYENANKKQQEALEKHGLDSEEYKIAKKEAEQRFEELNSATNNLKTKQQELRKLEESKSASTKKTSQKSQSTSNVDDIESRITELETSKKKVEDARKELEIAENKLKEAERKTIEVEIEKEKLEKEKLEKLFDKDELPAEKASEKYNNARDKVAEKEKALEDAKYEKEKKYEEFDLACEKDIEMLKKYDIDSEECELAHAEFEAKAKELEKAQQDSHKAKEELDKAKEELDKAKEELDKAKEELDKVEEEFFNEEFEKLDRAQEQADKIENQAQQQLDEAKEKYEIAKNEYQNKQSRLTEIINYEPKFEKIKEIKQSFENNYKMMREQAMEKLKKLYENLDEVRTAFGVNSKQYKDLKSAIAKKHEELKTIAERISKRRAGVKKYFEDLKDNLSETIDMPNKRTVTGEPAPVGKSEPIDKVGTKTDEPAISKNKGEEEIKDTSSVKSNKDETSPTAEEQMPKETEKQTTTYKGDSSLKTAIDDLVEKGKNLQKKQDELDLIKESISNSKKEFNDVLENQGITYEKVSSGEIQLKEGSKAEKYYSEISKAEEDYQKYLSIVNKEKDQFMKNRKEMLELRDKLDEFKQNYDCDYYDVKHGNKQLPEEAKELFEEIKSREEKYKFDNDSNMKVKETKTKENEIDQEELGKAASSKEETLETTPKSTQSEEKVIEVDFKNKTKGASQPEEIKIDELNKQKTQTKATEIDDTEEISLSMIDSSKLTEVEGQIKTLEKKINDLEADVRLKEKADDFSKKELDKIMKESKAKDKQIEKFEQETKLVKESYGDLEKRLRDSTPEDIDRQLEIQIKEKQKILDDIELERKAKGTSDYDFIYDPSPENVISNLETVKKNEFLELSRLIKEKNSIKNSKVLTHDQIKILETKYNNKIIENYDRIKAIDTRIKELKRPNSKEFEDLLLSSRDKVDVSDLEKRMQDNIDMMFNKKVNTRKPFNAKELKQEIKSLEIQKKMLKNMEDAKKEIESYDKAIYVMKHNANSQTAKQVKEIDPVGINSYYRKNYPRIVKEIEESKKTLKELQEQREELLKIKESSIESADLIEEITPEKVEELLGENHNQKDNIIELPTNNRKIEESSDDLKAANGEEIEGKKSVEDESEKTDNDKQKVKKVKKMAVKGAMLTGGIVGLTSLTKCDGNENTTGSEKSTIPEDDKSDSNKDIPEDDKSDSNKENPDKTEQNPESEKESSDKPEQNPESNKDKPEDDKSASNKETPDKPEQNPESEKESSDKPEQNPESEKDKPNTSKGYSSTSEKTSSNSANKNQVSDNSDSTSQRNTNLNSISDGFNENNNSTASSNNKRVDFNKFRVPAESNESEQLKKNDSEINSYDFENSTNSDFKEEVEDSNSFDDYFENEILSEDNNDENEEKQKESTISKGSSFIKENASSIGIGAAAAAGAGLGIVGLVKKSKEDKNKNDFEIEEYEEENDFSHNSDQESEKNNKKFHNPFTALRVKKEDDASFDD